MNNNNKLVQFMEDYRGFPIMYSIQEDKFYSVLDTNEEKKGKPRQALTAVRKDIDDHIKKNLAFKPFTALEANLSYGEDGKNRVPSELPTQVTIKSVKKNGGLFIEQKKRFSKTGETEVKQLNNNSYRDERLTLFIDNEHNNNICAQIAMLEAEEDQIREKKRKLFKKFQPLDISIFKTHIEE